MSLFQIIIYHNISDRISEMASGAGGVAVPGGGAAALAAVAHDSYGELADTLLTNEIQEYLLTKIISPRRLLSECFTCFLLSVPQRDLPDDASLRVNTVISYMSGGNHATIVCECAGSVGSPESRITAILKGEVLRSNTGVTTRRYDQAVGVAQPLFNHSVDRLKKLFVLGKGETEFEPAQLGVDVWDENWPVLADAIMEQLNTGISEGREAFKEKLIVLFEKIRALNDSDPKTRELRARYCIMAMDLLRDDIFQSFESTIQKGVLATINIHNSSDEYDRHHGKPVTDPMLAKAPYNLLILVNVVIGGYVYTIHMEIDREAVKELLKAASTAEHRSGDDIYQSVSYWIGDVIKWIHENKNEFFSIVKDVLDKSVPNVTGGVAPQIGFLHKTYLLQKMMQMLGQLPDDMPGQPPHEMPGQRPEIPLYQAIYVSGCKCFTLYHPDFSFRNVGDRPDTNRRCIVTTPNSDMTVGYYKDRKYFVSIKPITVTRHSIGEYTITDVNFTLPAAPLFHVPTYDTAGLLNQVIKPDDGDVFDSNGLFNSPDTGSVRIQDSVKSAAAAMEYEDAAAAAAAAEAAAAAAAVKKANFEMNQAKANAVSKMSADPMGPSVKGVNKKQQKRTSPSQTKNTDDPQKANEKKTLAYEKAGSAYKKADLAKKKVNAKAVAAASLIEEVKVGITKPETQPTELVKHIVSQEKTTPGILKQALNTICSTFHYLLSPFTSLQRLGVVIPHTVLLDQDTAMRISIVLMCACNYFKESESIIPRDQNELDAEQLAFDVAEKEFRAAEGALRAAEGALPAAKNALDAAENEFHAAQNEFHAAELEFRAAGGHLQPVKRASQLFKSKSRVVMHAEPDDDDDHGGQLDEDEKRMRKMGASKKYNMKTKIVTQCRAKFEAAALHKTQLQADMDNSKSRLIEAEKSIESRKTRIQDSQTNLRESLLSVSTILTKQNASQASPIAPLPRGSFVVDVKSGGMRRRTLRRGVKKNTRRERRDRSIRSRRCRRDCWQYSRSSGKLNKNTQRCRSRNSKTRRRRRNPNRQ